MVATLLFALAEGFTDGCAGLGEALLAAALAGAGFGLGIIVGSCLIRVEAVALLVAGGDTVTVALATGLLLVGLLDTVVVADDLVVALVMDKCRVACSGS